MPNVRDLKAYLREVLENPDSHVGKKVNTILVLLITLSIFFFIIETTIWGQQYAEYFHYFDIFVVSVFVVEYFVRLYIATNKKRFVCSFLSVIDLLVITSFYIALTNFSFLRSFRVFKILQLLKIFRYSEAVIEFFKSYKNYQNEFKIFGVALTVALVLGSCGMYYLEYQVNPDIATIPDAIWWAVVTLATVGYGDVVPMTWAGKILGGIMMFLGLAIIAIFTAINTKMFIDHFFGKKNHRCFFCHFPRHDFDAKFCKNCGGNLDKRPE